MAKKQYFAIVDTETTIKGTVADFACIIADRAGNIHAECAVLVADHYGVHELFHDKNAKEEIWTQRGLARRKSVYTAMLAEGSRMVASVSAINRWLEKAKAKFNPELTAYNLAFDNEKCNNTGIDVLMFDKSFCLWHTAVAHFAQSKSFRQFILENHCFNSPTGKGNMTFKTNAEVMASFVHGAMLPPEPHTALEDAKHYELPILKAIVKRKKWREKIKSYSWQDFQVKNHFKPA